MKATSQQAAQEAFVEIHTVKVLCVGGVGTIVEWSKRSCQTCKRKPFFQNLRHGEQG